MSHSPKEPIDEYTLAAFMAGSLPEPRRREVVAFLSENADARELLCMAQEALDVAMEPEGVALSAQQEAASSSSPAPRAPLRSAQTRPAVRHATPRLRQLRRLAVAALAVLVVGIGLRLSLNLETDTLRGGNESELTVRVTTPALQFRWNAIDSAYAYRLVIWNPQEAELVAQHETRNTRLDEGDSFLTTLRTRLQAGHTYSVRVDAYDAQNRLVQSSKLTDFVLPR